MSGEWPLASGNERLPHPDLASKRMTVPTHHTPRGFRNPWPDAEPKGLRDVIRWSIQRRRQRLAPDPAPGDFAVAEPLFEQRERSNVLGATWVGHSTVLLQIGSTNVLTDPIWSERASPVQFAGPKRFVAPAVDLDRLPPIDVVLISHNHYDHLDRWTIKQLARSQPNIHWIVPLRLAPLLSKWGAASLRELDWWNDLRLDTPGGSIEIACVPAQHFSARGLGDRGRSLWGSWVIRGSGHAVYFAGDTAYHPEFAEIARRYGPFDLALLPIGAYEPRWFMRSVHMNPPEALRAYGELAAAGGVPPIMLPIHWGTFRLTDESMSQPPEWIQRPSRSCACQEPSRSRSRRSMRRRPGATTPSSASAA